MLALRWGCALRYPRVDVPWAPNPHEKPAGESQVVSLELAAHCSPLESFGTWEPGPAAEDLAPQLWAGGSHTSRASWGIPPPGMRGGQAGSEGCGGAPGVLSPSLLLCCEGLRSRCSVLSTSEDGQQLFALSLLGAVCVCVCLQN